MVVSNDSIVSNSCVTIVTSDTLIAYKTSFQWYPVPQTLPVKDLLAMTIGTKISDVAAESRYAFGKYTLKTGD